MLGIITTDAGLVMDVHARRFLETGRSRKTRHNSGDIPGSCKIIMLGIITTDATYLGVER